MFKLVSTAQDVSICLRCQYRLSLRQGARPGRRRPTGYPQQLRHFKSRPSLQQHPSTAHDVATNDAYLGRAPIRYSTEEIYPRDGPPKKDKLGLSVLGQPAEVLILRDKKKRFQLDSAMAIIRVSGPDRNPTPGPISFPDLLEKMDAERGIIDTDAACKNIDSVRAAWAAETNGSITGDTYKDLISRLHVGFTRPQLAAYFDRAGKRTTAGVFDLDFRLHSSIYARSSWQPLGFAGPQKTRAPQLGETEKEVLVKESEQGLSKDALVKMIVTQCWDIKISLQGSSLGELYIRLRNHDIDLIINHKRNILKLMSRTYDSKVEAWPRDRIIRITSDYDNCVDIVKLLVHTIKNIRYTKLELDADSTSNQSSTSPRRKLNPAMLGQISEYTNTLIRSVQGTPRIYYLGPDNADLLETQRVIEQILRPVSTQVSKLAWSRGNKPSDANPVPVTVGSRLSMLNRNQQWTTWRSSHKDNQNQNTNDQDMNDQATRKEKKAITPRALHGKLAFDTVKAFFGKPDDTSYKLCGNNTPFWLQEIEYRDSVTFGQVLFPAKEALSVSRALRAQTKKRKSKMHGVSGLVNTRTIGNRFLRQRREFVPLVPGLVHSLTSFGMLGKNEEFLHIRLSPSSENASLPVPVKALPDLEIRISFDEEKKRTSIKDVRLVNRTEKDFLQPQDISDLRFIREQHVCADTKDNSIDPRITLFVQQSNFDIWGTERLQTPRGLSLSIPALAIQSHDGFDPKSYDTLLVAYTSLGLEHRSSLTIPYGEPDSWPTLTYTNIEAGRIAGRRDELSLHSQRFVSEQRPTTIDLDPSAPSTATESLSEDDHASILFQKTASLIKSIEQMGRERNDQPRWQTHEAARRSRRTETKRRTETTRRTEGTRRTGTRRTEKRKLRRARSEAVRTGRAGAPAAADDEVAVRRVVSDRSARPVAREVEKAG